MGRKMRHSRSAVARKSVGTLPAPVTGGHTRDQGAMSTPQPREALPRQGSERGGPEPVFPANNFRRICLG